MKWFRSIVWLLFVFSLLTPAAALAERKPDYAEDLGLTAIDVSKYPSDMQHGYQLMEAKCMRCHSVARAVNSNITQAKDWARYINRMRQRPPCCNLCPVITAADAKAIYRFLVYDSQIRKTGPKAARWQASRQKLLDEYRQKYPKQYAERYSPSKGKDQP